MKDWGFAIPAGLASGALLAFAMPLTGGAGLAWFALMPVLAATKGKGGFMGFVSGITGALFGGWISTTPMMGPAPIVSDGWAWNIVGFGLYGIVMSFFTMAAAEVKTHSWKSLLLLSCLGVALELVTFIKLPAHIALSQFASAPMLWAASVTGIWGVSWLIWAANLTILLPREGRQRAWGLAACCLLAAVSQTTSSIQRARLDPRPIASREPGQAGLLQTTASGAGDLLRQQAPLSAVRPSFVVWPELSVDRSDMPLIQDFASRRDGWTVITTMHDAAQPKPHNAARAFTPQGMSAPYFKRKPFGSEEAMIQAGSRPVVVKVVPLSVGLNICFDSCYPWIMRDTVLDGAELIALPTLDPPSPNGFIQAAHGAFTSFRAAELGVPFVRAEASAWSMIVGSDGLANALAPVGWEGAMSRALPRQDHPTVYRIFGDWFLYGCLGALGGWLAVQALKALKPRPSAMPASMPEAVPVL